MRRYLEGQGLPLALALQRTSALTGLDWSGFDTHGDLAPDETAALGEAQLGVKYFVADNVAIALYGFYDVSDKEIFTNKDEMEKYDFGARLGMNTYF